MKRVAVIVWAGVLAAASMAPAAVVRTVNGATLIGTVTAVAGGRLTLTPATTRPTPTTAPAVSVQLADVADVTFGPAVASARPNAWLIQLTDGDRMHAAVDRWAEGTVILRPSVTAADVAVPVPAERLAEAWVPGVAFETATREKARALVPADAGADDVALVRKDATTTTAVRGKALGLAGDSLTFRFDGRDRKIAMAKLVGVVFGSRPPPAATGPHFTVSLADGDVLSGEWVAMTADRLTVRTSYGQTIVLANKRVVAVASVGGRLTYLSDLRPARVEQSGYFGRVVPYRTDHALGGGPIRLADGTTFARGVATHARCVLEYDLGSGYDRFLATVGFEQPGGAAAVQLLVDGRVAYDAPAARGDQPPAKLDVSVAGGRRLSVVVDFGPDGDTLARVSWADARLLRRAVPPTTGPTTTEGRP